MRECKLPLRIVLQNFINNVESLESKSSNTDEVYEQEFQELKKLTESLKTHPDFVCTEGEKECNRRKNRYKDILPYDKSRVVLQAFPGIPGSDYINANYIRGASGSRAYIASQGPLPNTVPDFWRMVVECDVQVIIMASNETEGGKHKCECYWVENEGEEKQFGNVSVSFIKSRQVCPDFLVRTLKIKFTTEKDTMEERTICQFHYMLWPDHGVPDTVRPLLHMVRLVRDCQASETLPVLVHCSAGCGRTGTICAIDYVWGLLRTGKLTANLYLLGLVREMRMQRVAMVQTKEQYSLLHQAVKELFRERLSLIDSHPYENVATDGNPISIDITESKESDYEELLMSRENYDDNVKPYSSPVPSTTGGSLSSLIKNSNEQHRRKLLSGKDHLRRSASTSSLDVHKVLPGKENISFPSSTSASFDASVQQFASHPVAIKTSEPSLGDIYSKLVKDITDKEDKDLSRFISSPTYSVLTQKKSKSAASTPTGLQLGSQEFAMLMSPNSVGLNPPFPTPRSRTPSPVFSSKKNILQSKNGLREEKRKNTELVRRPSIQKLKEMFEKPRNYNIIECPNGMRLSRSASSVTPRPSLSLQNDDTMSLKSRKACMGSDQFLAQIKSKDDNMFKICPPPPLEHRDGPFHPNAQSSSSFNFLGVKRKESHDEREVKAPSTISRSDDRPALPVKKSKSFRWARSQGNANNMEMTSPEFRRKKKTDINSYFSLDRGKENTSVRTIKGEDSIKKIANDFFPSHQEGLKFSVYEASRKKDSSNFLSSVDKLGIKKHTKPQIPPKKSKIAALQPLQIPLLQPIMQIVDGDTVTNSKEMQTTPLSAPPSSSISFKNKEFWDKVQASCFENFYDDLSVESELNTVNVVPPPKPSRATPMAESLLQTRGNQDYVNAKVLSSYLDEEPPKVSYVPLPSKREFKDKSNHDYVNCSVFPHSNSKVTKNKASNTTNSIYDDAYKQKPFQEKNSTKQLPLHSLAQSSDYEPVDFGETVNSVDEVFETLNYELIESKSDENKKKERIMTPRRDYYLNKDLDSLAIQVYQDCQAYLLHGNNRSPLPSIMPKSPTKDNSQSITKIPTPSEELPVTNLEEVKNKVSVPPQGLRNRERRNSYRQAVNTSSPSHSKAYEKQMNALKKVHKYEKIWFESMKEELDEDVMKKIESEKLGQDFSTNFNTQMNISGKENLFKDKLEELHGLVSNMENKKLPDLSEEEISSRDSGSTSSLLSRSAQSSRSSERVEPIYANALPGYRSSTSSSSEVAGKHPYSSLVSGASPYGTLATTTSYPYKQKLAGTQHIAGGNDGSYPYKLSSNAATLPARSSTSPPVQNIPPPQGFGNPSASVVSSYKEPTKSSDNQKEKFYFPPIFKEFDKNIDPLKDLVKGKRKPKKESSKTTESGHLGEGQVDRKEDKISARRQKKSETISSFLDKAYLPSNPSPSSSSASSSAYYHIPSFIKPFPHPADETAEINGSNREKVSILLHQEISSTDTEDDSSTSKSSSNIFLRKLRSAKLTRDDEPIIGDNSPHGEEKDKGKRSLVSPPGSPRSFSKAFGKFKMGSKSVAANFRSYLGASKNSTENSNAEGSSDALSSHYPLQKSVSSGPSVNVFSQVMENSSLPCPLTKNSNQEPLYNFRCYDHPKDESKLNRARQQYL